MVFIKLVLFFKFFYRKLEIFKIVKYLYNDIFFGLKYLLLNDVYIIVKGNDEQLRRVVVLCMCEVLVYLVIVEDDKSLFMKFVY